MGILPIQSFGDHVKEDGGFGFIKSDTFMEMFGDVGLGEPMVIKLSQADGAEVTLTAVPHNEDDGVFVPDWVFEILNSNEPVHVEKMDTSELPVIKEIVVRMFIKSETTQEVLQEHFYDFKVLHSNIWFKIDDETVIVEHLIGEDGAEIMLGRLTEEVAVTVNISGDVEPVAAPPVPVVPVEPARVPIDMTEERPLAPPAPPTEEEKRAAREARLRYFSRQP